MFDKAAFLQAIKPKTEAVDIDGFGTVTLKQLCVSDVELQRERLKNEKEEEGQKLFGLRLLVASVIDESGAAVFTEDDIQALRSSSNAPVETLVGKVLALNGFAKGAAKN